MDQVATPVIGITCYVEEASWTVWRGPAALIPLTYVRAVEAAGGRPVLVPPSPVAVDETLAALDGIIFSGGADLDPQLYGAERHRETTGMRPDRDRSELPLLEAALERDVPVLAICRGMQLLNVAKGGELRQHLDDGRDGVVHRRSPGVFARHEVSIAADSSLAGLLGDRPMVLSHHHQAPDRLGRGLEAVAWAEDDTIEGIEDPSRAFAVGILWHPEEGEDRALFEALVKRASRVKEHR
ncbi:MAG: gamma-glutamyl-gamma-aminobutyrate hydrolase family protein [Actinomycetota bacterium]